MGSEFTAVVEACRATIDGDKFALSDTGLDGARLLRMARFHRVQGLVWHSFAASDLDLPKGIAAQLADDARAIADANLRTALEARDLLAAFKQARIPILFVKGLTLGTLAYGEISLKSSIDIDILVGQADVARAAAVLSELDYQLIGPRMAATTAALVQWHRHRKESVWSHRSRGIQIDLHTRLADNRILIPALGVNSPTREVEVAPGISLPTLGKDHLFAYLSVHGASSMWFRLKWIADLAALIGRECASELERLYRRSQELGAGRTSGLALLLADALFDSLRNAPRLRAELCTQRALRRLARSAILQLGAHGEPKEPTATPFGTARIHFAQFLLAPGAAFKLSEARRQMSLIFVRP